MPATTLPGMHINKGASTSKEGRKDMVIDKACPRRKEAMSYFCAGLFLHYDRHIQNTKLFTIIDRYNLANMKIYTVMCMQDLATLRNETDEKPSRIPQETVVRE